MKDKISNSLSNASKTVPGALEDSWPLASSPFILKYRKLVLIYLNLAITVKHYQHIFRYLHDTKDDKNHVTVNKRQIIVLPRLCLVPGCLTIMTTTLPATQPLLLFSKVGGGQELLPIRIHTIARVHEATCREVVHDANTCTTDNKVIEKQFIQKRRQRSSLLFGGPT